jgi:hypothetical protein
MHNLCKSVTDLLQISFFIQFSYWGLIDICVEGVKKKQN